MELSREVGQFGASHSANSSLCRVDVPLLLLLWSVDFKSGEKCLRPLSSIEVRSSPWNVTRLTMALIVQGLTTRVGPGQMP
jgi:hypothetical protein